MGMADPCEHRDLSSNPAYGDDLDRLWRRLATFRAVAVPASATASPDPESCPGTVACNEHDCHGLVNHVMPCDEV
jgi:hypothetical protein